MSQQAMVFIHTARATRENFAETEQKARSTRNSFFGMLIPAALLLCALFIFSLLRSWETATWGPAIITGVAVIITIFGVPERCAAPHVSAPIGVRGHARGSASHRLEQRINLECLDGRE